MITHDDEDDDNEHDNSNDDEDDDNEHDNNNDDNDDDDDGVRGGRSTFCNFTGCENMKEGNIPSGLFPVRLV